MQVMRFQPLTSRAPVHSQRKLTVGSPTKRMVHASVGAGGGSDKIGVLMVCLGNICRSPTAEAVFRAAVQRAGLEDKLIIDSCGTGGGNPDWYFQGGWSYHEGEEADSRMTAAASRRGVVLTSRSRPLQPLDLSHFQYIIGMESKNLRAVQVATEYWLKSSGKDIPDDWRSRLSLATDYMPATSKHRGVQAVPDPYYGGNDGFEMVLDLLEDACEGLLDHICRQQGLQRKDK